MDVADATRQADTQRQVRELTERAQGILDATRTGEVSAQEAMEEVVGITAEISTAVQWLF